MIWCRGPAAQQIGWELQKWSPAAYISHWTSPRLQEADMEMSSGKQSGKSAGKPARQLLFTEALFHSHPMANAQGSSLLGLPETVTDQAPEGTMERILREITAARRRLEGMDSNISALTAETKSICLDIAGFKTC
ncbi:hypothetical protein NDU88_000713 [Pleurodeles waltl]|uniref:Uncharacterized protein n=1 Tax=Pleurodeles waltl TaxID=8319 RepID=A0AAV7U4R9_PLEWA|nr:hypothetical protein NDU88_000713 [Pleurodeles waltl]